MGTIVETARARAAQLIQDAETEERIREALTAAGAPEPRFVHVSGRPLYGTAGSVSWGDSRGLVSGEGLAALVAALPPCGLVQVRDGCLSHMPATWVDSLPEAKKERWQAEIGLAGLYLDVDPLSGCALHWYAPTGAGVLRCEATIARPEWLAVTWPRREHRGHTTIDPVQVRIDGGAVCAYSPDGEPLAQLDPPIRWASGGPEYGQRITLTWSPLGTDPEHGELAAAIVASLAAPRAGRAGQGAA